MIKSIKKISKKHYIQCGLAVLLTGLVLYFISALWYSNAIIVSFNAEAKKDITYQVFYTGESGQTINEKQSVKKPIKSGNQKVEILLPIEKIMKFRLDIGVQPGKVVISDLQVKGGKNVKLNYNDFGKNQIDKYEVKDGGKLYITSKQVDPYIWYKPELNLPAGMQIDWCRLIIISVLAFLLMYKFVQYLSKFKIEKQHSRIDIVMLAVFFALLFVPMSHISDAEKSEQEKRMLAKKPQLTIDGGGYNNYGVQFDAWYNDHFFGRDTMIGLHNSIRYLIAPIAGNEKVLVGKNNWLFSNFFNSTSMYQNSNRFTEEELEKIGYNIEKFVQNAVESGIKQVYFVLDNDKESLYSEYYPSYIKKEYTESRLEQLLNYVHKNHPSIKFFNFKNKLQEIGKKETLFYKTGTHMNHIGDFYTYRFLMEKIKKDFSGINLLSLESFTIQESDDFNQPDLDLDLYSILKPTYYPRDNIKNKILKPREVGVKLKYHSGDKYVQENIFINEYAQNRYKIFAIGDSFLLRRIHNIAASVERTYHIFIGFGKALDFSDKAIEDLYKNIPDIMIVQSTERFLQRFLTLEFPKNPNSSKKEN